MSQDNLVFTEQEVSYIDGKMHSIIFEWGKSLIAHILQNAQSSSVDVVYMNTKETVFQASNKEKLDFYMIDYHH